METPALSEQFKMLLERGAQELFEDNHHRMACADLFTSRHTIADDDLRRFFLGLQHGTVTLVRGARFNTLDRPVAVGRWGLLSREKGGCRYNAEYLPQIAAYVEAIQELGYPSERVFFELPHTALKLDPFGQLSGTLRASPATPRYEEDADADGCSENAESYREAAYTTDETDTSADD